MLTNVVDKRTNPYRWREVTAIVEPTFQDNGNVGGADEAVPPPVDWSYDELARTSVAGAIAFAAAKPGPTTLYIYDLGKGIDVDPAVADRGTRQMFSALFIALVTGVPLLWAWFQVFPNGVHPHGSPLVVSLVFGAAVLWLAYASLCSLFGAVFVIILLASLPTGPLLLWNTLKSWKKS